MPPNVLSRLSTFEACPVEVLERVILAAVNKTLRGPPTDLPSLLLVSRTLHNKISLNTNPSLYSAIFVAKFDDLPAVRRLGGTCKFKFMPCRLFSASSTACDDLWVAYLMFLENDGRNYEQLVHYAGVDKFASEFIAHAGPFHDGEDQNGGWKLDTQVNALAAWLFWFTDKERVENETPEHRKHVLAAFTHIFVGSYMYPSTHAPVTSFWIHPSITPVLPPHTAGIPLAALPPSRVTYIKDHFDFTIPVTSPLLTPVALLICAVRLEAGAAKSPSSLPEPANEHLEIHRRPTTRFAEWGPGLGSDQYDHDWMRLITCYSPWSQPVVRRRVFTPGMLAGTWLGRLFEIPREQFNRILSPHILGYSTFVHVYNRPMCFELHEHHLFDYSQPIDYDDITRDLKGNGVFNAWFPKGFDTSRIPANYHTHDPIAAARRTLDDEYTGTGLYKDGVCDIIVTGKITDGFDDVRSHKRYFGRVRDWDGLILLVGVATPTAPSRIFSGYVHGNRSIVGRWRETDTPVEVPGWEGAWSMTKVE